MSNAPLNPPLISRREIRQAIIDLSEIQAQLDSLKITLYKSLNALHQQQGGSNV